MDANVDLTSYNTFRVAVKAKNFIDLRNLGDLSNQGNLHVLFLGHGANILFTKDFDGLVIKNSLTGKRVLSENNEEVVVEVASGEDWSKFVLWTVENGYSGIENMAGIPGTIGAAAVGNIAAYGQTFEDTCQSVTTIDKIFRAKDCQFGYRESIFKRKNQSQFITSVTFKLSKTAHFSTDYHSRYESLKSELPPNPPYTPKQIALAVMSLRSKKLPDLSKVGTAGSFFKNPNITKKRYQELAKEVKELQCYPPNKLAYDDLVDTDTVKIPAARLLDELGWKGRQIGQVATHDKQALCVINLGGATGQEILDFALQMQADIKTHYDILLEPEVRII